MVHVGCVKWKHELSTSPLQIPVTVSRFCEKFDKEVREMVGCIKWK